MAIDGPFKWYRTKAKRVQARRVTRRKPIKTDRGWITLDRGDWEIIGPDGTMYGNTPEQFEATYEEDGKQ